MPIINDELGMLKRIIDKSLTKVEILAFEAQSKVDQQAFDEKLKEE